jgi:hypothetical protein
MTREMSSQRRNATSELFAAYGPYLSESGVRPRRSVAGKGFSDQGPVDRPWTVSPVRALSGEGPGRDPIELVMAARRWASTSLARRGRVGSSVVRASMLQPLLELKLEVWVAIVLVRKFVRGVPTFDPDPTERK